MNKPKAPYVVNGDGRIYLRDVRKADITNNYINWMNDEDVVQYLECRFTPHTSDSISEFIEGTNSDTESVLFAVCLKEGDVHIGNIKLGKINWLHGFAEMSILIGLKECWGKGYATEAIKLLTDYAFTDLGVKKLTAECYSDNLGSFNAFKKAGYHQEGTRQKHYTYKDKRIDSLMLGCVSPQEK